MSLQAIVEKIKTEAQTEAQKLLSVAEDNSLEIKEETQNQINEIKNNFQTILDKQKEKKRTIVHSLERQKLALAAQTVKRRLLDSVYYEALETIIKLPANEYIAIFVGKYEKLVPKDVEIDLILAPEARQAETAEICKALNWSAQVEVSLNLRGGCILKSKNFEYDLSIEKLFTDTRSNSEIEIAQLLFRK